MRFKVFISGVQREFVSAQDELPRMAVVRRTCRARSELEWVLDLPQKVFAAGVHTVVLFFRKGRETKKPINYYQLDLKGVSLGKTRSLTEGDLAEFERLAKGGGDAEDKAKAEKLEAKAREGAAVCETMRKAILKEAFE